MSRLNRTATSFGACIRWAELFLISFVAACVVAQAPIKTTSQIVATPQPGQLDVSSQQGALIGDVQPVYVSIANGTDTPRAIVPSQIFALDASGNRIAPLPPGEAARQAGGSGELKAALESGATSAVLGAGIGAGLGAITGAFLHSGGTGAARGTALGGGQAGIQGAIAGQSKADQQATAQLNALALQQTDVRRNFTVSGYVFSPKAIISNFNWCSSMVKVATPRSSADPGELHAAGRPHDNTQLFATGE